MGAFEIKENNLDLWIEFDKSNSNFCNLSLFLKNNDNFTALILDGCGLGYSCFGCYALDDCNIPQLDFGFIKLSCNRWIEALHIDSEDILLSKKAHLEFPFIEYWFTGVDNAIFPVGNEYAITCLNRKQEYLENFKSTKLEYRHCWFEIQFENEKSLKDIIKVEEAIWLFLRFATNIPIPRAEICIPYCSMPEKYFKYHFQFGHHPIIKDYANASAYADMPIKLCSIVNNKDIFSRWVMLLKKYYHSIKMWSKEMGRTSLLDERISHYVQIIDALTKDGTCLKNRIQQCFEKYSNQLPFIIDQNTSKNLKQIRVSFSHLNDEEFIEKDKISGKNYLEYEKIVQELIRILITSNLNLQEI